MSAIPKVAHGLPENMVESRRRALACVTCWVFMLIGCASVPAAAPVYDPATQARLRVFLGDSTDIIFGDVCAPGPHEKVKLSAGGLSYLGPNKVLGMPQIDDMPSSRFHEYVLPAGTPVTIKHFWQQQALSGIWQSCGPFYLTVHPVAGADYETFMRFDRGACMGAELRRLRPAGDGKLIAYPARLDRLPFTRCG